MGEGGKYDVVKLDAELEAQILKLRIGCSGTAGEASEEHEEAWVVSKVTSLVPGHHHHAHSLVRERGGAGGGVGGNWVLARHIRWRVSHRAYTYSPLHEVSIHLLHKERPRREGNVFVGVWSFREAVCGGFAGIRVPAMDD